MIILHPKFETHYVVGSGFHRKCIVGHGFGSALSGLFKSGVSAIRNLFAKSGVKSAMQAVSRGAIDRAKSLATPENLQKALPMVGELAASLAKDAFAKKSPLDADSDSRGAFDRGTSAAISHLQTNFIAPTEADARAHAEAVLTNLTGNPSMAADVVSRLPSVNMARNNIDEVVGQGLLLLGQRARMREGSGVKSKKGTRGGKGLRMP